MNDKTLVAKKPDFLCIGASKAGTTWLHEQFMSHADVWVPFVKELHYFDHPNVKRWIHALAQKSIYGTHTRSAILKGMYRGQFLWLYKYLFKERKLEWYHELFPANSQLTTGEITPSYSRLPEQTIQDFAKLQPDCKIIYILRNPVDRIWSQLNMIRKRRTGQMTDDEIYARINKRHYEASNYLENLAKWERCFPKENIYIGFYDELKSDPIAFLNKIYSFLGVDTLPQESREMRRSTTIINKGKYTGFPQTIRERLTGELYENISQIHERFDNQYTHNWLLEAKEILAK